MSNDNTHAKQRVAVVGAGLVGATQACFLAKRGFEVDLYEAREDIRIQEIVKGRSINLAFSLRGRTALSHIGVKDKIVAEGIPMNARRIHTRDGKLYSLKYGTKKDQYIMSIDRRKLNEQLLTAAEKYDTVKVYFNHKFIRCNFDTGEIVFLQPDGKQVTRKADLICGCDGAFSAVRRQIMRMGRFDYSQMYIPHGYMEFTMPPKNNEFAMEVNFLHIWPRNEFMLIALPNIDKTFTCTLFMPFYEFEGIKTESDLMAFWHNNFEDSIPFIGEENIKKTFFGCQPLPLITVKCTPYHYGNSGVIMGDAAHAMVPFYGQGMNCGLEDCTVFDGILDQCNNDLAKALPEFTRIRNPDAKAICDLALYNYIEMRSSVNSRWFIFRKKVDNLLHWILPNTFVPLYTMVTFTRMRYHIVINQWKKQDRAVNTTLLLMLAASVTSLGYLTWKHNNLSMNHILPLERISELISSFRK